MNNDETYLSLCKNLGLNEKDFLEVFHSETIKNETQETFALAQKYASSYPTLLAEKEDNLYILEQGYAPLEAILKQIDNLFN